MRLSFIVVSCLVSLDPNGWSVNRVWGGDWPMWRYDAGRTAHAEMDLSPTLFLQWERKLPQLKPAYRNQRLQFDASYEPIVKGKTLFVSSSHNDSVTAYDTDTGKRKWQFFTDGPVRFAPVAWNDRVYFGSDDGHLYCLNAANGSLAWKFRAVPSNRKLLGNGRLISVWPIRGGPVIADSMIYFAAGVWSFEGVFVYALDAETGKVFWLNDRTGYLYGQHPHAAEAFGGLTPQGYLVVNGDELIVPCGSALPAKFDRKTGRLESFALPKKGRYPGGWFTAAARARRRGQQVEDKDKKSEDSSGLVLDVGVNSDRHEDGDNHGPGSNGIRSTIVLGKKTFSFEDGYEGVTGKITSMLAADGKLFVVTLDGTIRCFGSKKVAPTKREDTRLSKPTTVVDSARVQAARILNATNITNGFCIVIGADQGQLIEALLEKSALRIIAIDNDSDRVLKLRTEFDQTGIYGERVTFQIGTPDEFRFPPYLASLIVCNQFGEANAYENDEFVSGLFNSLRPYGGTAYFSLKGEQAVKLTEQIRSAKLPKAALKVNKDNIVLRRTGSLPGTTNFTGGWSKSQDKLVKAPMGVLWFDDIVGHFKRSPQPFFVDGVMVSHDKLWKGYPSGDRPPYALKKAVYSDVYTGRVFSKAEIRSRLTYLPTLDIEKKQPSQYRPATQKNDWKPAKPIIGDRVNPLTGVTEPRAIIKSYGCDGGNDYGLIYTMRSGTAAYYDKRIESGTIHISGPRSGCTNSIIPANGLLNVPYFYQGCTCSYPLPVGLALVHMPAEYEQWTVWGPGKPKSIQRVGINFGAPGDRATDAGTLWLDYPVVGGPSPELSVTVEPKNAEPYYHHSLWIDGGNGWPWVAASGLNGVSSVTIAGLKKSDYTVRLYFAEPNAVNTGDRTFDVLLQGRSVIQSLDILREAGGRMRSLVKEFRRVHSDGSLTITLSAKRGKPILSGIELIADGLKPGAILKLTDQSGSQSLISN